MPDCRDSRNVGATASWHHTTIISSGLHARRRDELLEYPDESPRAGSIDGSATAGSQTRPFGRWRTRPDGL